ncbi:MAG: TonB family protein [Prevotella sp.]|nr:TonB family protein [Prevotella sp.]
MRYKCMFLLLWAIPITLFSQGTAGEMYETGFDFHYGRNGKAKDDVKAVEWFRKAADQGGAEAQAQMGYMYLYGYGVNKDFAEALNWYRKAAEQDDASAQNQLGYMYLNGYGVNKDYAEALKWYRKAADKGLPSGQNGLGFMAQNGYGMNKDYAEAFKWYLQAAEQGNATAKNNIGTMYFNGYGVARDYAEALMWYRQAAEQGDPNGQYSLGFMYDNGFGVDKNLAEARKWYEKAAAQGDEDAKERLKTIEQDSGGTVKVDKANDVAVVGAVSARKDAVDSEPSRQAPVGEPDNKDAAAQVLEVVDVPPAFPGNVLSWLAHNIHYPPIACEKNIQGRVIVDFIVETDGSVSNVKVLKGVDPSLDKEAVRVVKTMPKWDPGKQNGQPVRVRKNLPVTFKLK